MADITSPLIAAPLSRLLWCAGKGMDMKLASNFFKCIYLREEEPRIQSPHAQLHFMHGEVDISLHVTYNGTCDIPIAVRLVYRMQ